MGQANFDVDAVNAELQIAATADREARMNEEFDAIVPPAPTYPDAISAIDEVMRDIELSAIEAGEYGHGDWVDDIRLMHTKFGVREVIRKLDTEKKLKFLEFRLNFLQEELDEAKLAHSVLLMSGTTPEERTVAGDDIVDAMIDLCVVAIGTLDAFDVDSYEAWNRVLVKNMEKEPGIKPERPNPLGLPDLIKPTGWTAPSHADNIGTLPC